jgi:methionyl-tRNA synthetase
MNQENNGLSAAEIQAIRVEEAQAAEAASSTPDSGAVAPVPAIPVAEELIDIEHFAKVKLRVGLVTSAEAVPKSKKLLKLQVSLGEQLGTRQILSGIAQFYSPETIVGKRIIVVANLQAAKLMGLESQGMLLAGSTDDNSVLEILVPDEKLPLGTLIR